MKALSKDGKRVFVRLKKSTDFQLVLKAKGANSFSCSSRWFELKMLLGENFPHCLFGFTVGKRFAARAVDRNLVKRILRESVRYAVFSLDGGKFCGLKTVIRLKRKLPLAGKEIGRSSLKKMLRDDADALLLQLKGVIRQKILSA